MGCWVEYITLISSQSAELNHKRIIWSPTNCTAIYVFYAAGDYRDHGMLVEMMKIGSSNFLWYTTDCLPYCVHSCWHPLKHNHYTFMGLNIYKSCQITCFLIISMQLKNYIAVVNATHTRAIHCFNSGISLSTRFSFNSMKHNCPWHCSKSNIYHSHIAAFLNSSVIV